MPREARESKDAKEDSKTIQCVIKHHLATLRQSDKGWTREVNVVSWEGAPARLDIRDWSKNKERSSKGLTFTRKEAEKLRELLSIMNLGIIEDDVRGSRIQQVKAAYASENAPALADVSGSAVTGDNGGCESFLSDEALASETGAADDFEQKDAV